ncbi:hypothetical protein OG234_15150 [Streptomyces sp. NBC_01420]|uniref:hypothetical protein n=1 Tax=Streptomyces sp. NBC_01420 TaxID=2903858 RepID=UPI0032506280
MSHPAVPNRRRKTWIAPLISTIVTPPLAFFAFALTVFSAMACDACSAAENHSFAASINPAWIVFRCGQVLALLAIVVSWVFVRNRPAAAILLALAAPVTVFLSLGIFMTVVDWP